MKSDTKRFIFCCFSVIMLFYALFTLPFKIVNSDCERKPKDNQKEFNHNLKDDFEKIHKKECFYPQDKKENNKVDASIIEDKLVNWNFLNDGDEKYAFLTFDDGPSVSGTNKILECLDKNDVSATFFVLGSMIEKNPNGQEMIKKIVQKGHALGNHGYSHDYKKLYPSGVVNPMNFMEDIKKTENLLLNTLGKDIPLKVIRFPGGHSSWDTSEIDPILKEQGYSFVDWNVVNGDAESNTSTPEELFARFKETFNLLSTNNDIVVVLMHDMDSKENTVSSLNSIIEFLKNNGYEFKTINSSSS